MLVMTTKWETIMSSIDPVALRKEIDATLNKMIERFYKEVPKGSYQRDNKEIDVNYYKRHCIETILRIRHKRMIDALVIYHFTKHNLRAAKMWAEYTEDEMMHGNMFGKDLERQFGLTMDDIYKMEPLFATQLLNGYFYFTLEHEGPMAAITSAYFLEYTTRHTQPDWLDNLEKIFGKDNVRGARAHVDHDIKDNHNDFVWDVLMMTVKNDEDVRKLNKHLNRIYGLFAAYFTELNQVAVNSEDADTAAPVSAVQHAGTDA